MFESNIKRFKEVVAYFQHPVNRVQALNWSFHRCFFFNYFSAEKNNQQHFKSYILREEVNNWLWVQTGFHKVKQSISHAALDYSKIVSYRETVLVSAFSLICSPKWMFCCVWVKWPSPNLPYIWTKNTNLGQTASPLNSELTSPEGKLHSRAQEGNCFVIWRFLCFPHWKKTCGCWLLLHADFWSSPSFQFFISANVKCQRLYGDDPTRPNVGW